jgi:dihydroflavonol-4-reductase
MTQTVLLTGASGFIAKHVLQKFLLAGLTVRASVRTAKREDEVIAALEPGAAKAAQQRLSFVHLDLTDDAGWQEAAEGVDAVVHTASPFPIAQPADAEALIRPAVDGTLRALRAAQAAGVGRVVLTSSIAAIMRCDLPSDRDQHDETDWTHLEHPAATFYDRSKTMAERAAWDFVLTEAPGMALTTINPGFVLGPPLDDTFGSSVAFIKRLLSGKDPMLPALGLPIVDVRDVAEMHLCALRLPETAGKRYPATAGSMWFVEMSRRLKAKYPDRRLATREAPKLLMRLIALFDAEVKSILPDLGQIYRVSNRRAVEDMGMNFIPAEQAMLATAAYLVRRKLV